ncbi:DNA-binding LacI/PurR family transcriptional regulator [Anaerotaenia torta]|uniref:LacI family DNA-binding transcriptional regulator n=1 Tax=Anaerotaenia torta TaxID=433293 RepID=UPI003D1D2E1C
MILILEDSNKPKNITIYDIAREAGVSSATVSRAISGKGYVSEINKEKIKELVQKYNFIPNTFAQNLQSGFTKSIGYIVPHIGNMYFANVYYEFEKWASRHGYVTILLNSKGDYELESKLLGAVKEKRVDGIVMMGGRMDEINLSDHYIREVEEITKSIPFVSCGAQAGRFGCRGIYTDDEKGMEELLHFLKNCGYKRICLVGGGDQYYPSWLKKKSAYETGEKLGLEVSVRWLTGNDVFSYSAGYDSMKILLGEGRLPEVICGINDYVALGVINCALGAGLRVPDDIAVTGFDDVSITTMTPVHITTVSPRYEYYGKKVFNSLHKLIQNKDTGSSKTTLIRPELVIRNSTRLWN